MHRGGDTHPDGALGHFCVEVTLRQTPFQHQVGVISRCPQGMHGHPQSSQEPCRHLGHWVGDRVVRAHHIYLLSPSWVFLLDSQSWPGSSPEVFSGSASLSSSCLQKDLGPSRLQMMSSAFFSWSPSLRENTEAQE